MRPGQLPGFLWWPRPPLYISDELTTAPPRPQTPVPAPAAPPPAPTSPLEASLPLCPSEAAPPNDTTANSDSASPPTTVPPPRYSYIMPALPPLAAMHDVDIECQADDDDPDASPPPPAYVWVMATPYPTPATNNIPLRGVSPRRVPDPRLRSRKRGRPSKIRRWLTSGGWGPVWLCVGAFVVVGVAWGVVLLHFLRVF